MMWLDGVCSDPTPVLSGVLRFHIGAAYSTWRCTKALYAATLVSFGARVKFRLRKPSVLVALMVTLLMC